MGLYALRVLCLGPSVAEMEEKMSKGFKAYGGAPHFRHS